MRHEYQIPGLEPVVVQSMVIDVWQDGARAQAVSTILSVHILAQFFHFLDTGNYVGRNLTLESTICQKIHIIFMKIQYHMQ